MFSIGISLQPCISPAAASPKNRLQVAASQRIFLLKALNLSGRVSGFDDWTRSRRYARPAISEKPPTAAVQIDAAGGSKDAQITISVGYNGSEGAVPVLFLPEKALETEEESDLKKRIAEIKGILRSMSDGEISISAYDTAWVALVPDLNGSGGPQFPASLKWIEDNQLPDGSWGDRELFIAHDRLMNTLACVIALKSWGVSPDICQRGISFLSDNMKRLDEEDLDHMPIGFEVAFPSLVEIARSLDLHIPFLCPGLEEINNRKSLKMKRIPKDMLHQEPTTLLHSLEGMTGLEWEKILRHQCADGSLLFSPSSTAFALMCTGDRKCLDYLQRIVRRFNGGVPNVYPVDLFERLWAVDRLERLGISRYFCEEIRQCLDYVYSYWTRDGISWARVSKIQDVDDTAMGFRLLRLHGYDVTPDVFRRFEKDGEFFCLPGQSTQAVTGMYNLNRAAHLSYPGEEILLAARRFSIKYLQERRALNKLTDKWIITKDLPGEVGYALELPWYASLPRVEARFYLEQYGGESDVWIGKTLYRMPYVNNEDFLEFAKLDFHRCQSLHKLEWLGLQRWFEDSGISRLGVSKKNLMSAYFIAAASIFEPERAAERLGWARTAVLADAVSAHLTSCGGDPAANSILDELSQSFSASAEATAMSSSLSKGNELQECLMRLLDLLALEAYPSPPTTHDQIRAYICRAWKDWLEAQRREEDDTGLLLVRSLELCAGRTALEESLTASSQTEHCHSQLSRLISSLSRRLRPFSGDEEYTGGELDPDMQELVKLVLSNSRLDEGRTLQAFLNVARSLYYAAICSPAAFELHVDKVLLQAVF